MARLHRRIRQSGGNHKRAMSAWTPVAAGETTGGAASPSGAPGVMPLAQVTVYPEPGRGGQYSTVAYRGLAPIFTSGQDAAAVPATSPGRWGQLVAAGRP